MDEVLTLLRRAEGLSGAGLRSRLARFGSTLTISGAPAKPLPATVRDADKASRVAGAGFTELPVAASSVVCERLADAIARLTAAGLPAVFVYCFDEPWAIGEHLAASVSAHLGCRYAVAEDVWAWHIAPGAGAGWPVHRGVATPLLARNAPELLNIWLALSDVEIDRACMHFVPLDEDPSYPAALVDLDVPSTAVQAVPLVAGDALAWNANVLHWGGACAPTARGPRVSCSFSLVREDAVAALGIPLATRATTDLVARLEAMARQLLTYGRGQPDVREPVLEWAQATVALASLFGGGGAP